MTNQSENLPPWIYALQEEDFHFIKRFLLASGSLKALACEYGISYPTVRIRLDRLIAKIKAVEDQNQTDAFQRYLGILLAEGTISAETAKKLNRIHQDTLELQCSPQKSSD